MENELNCALFLPFYFLIFKINNSFFEGKSLVKMTCGLFGQVLLEVVHFFVSPFLTVAVIITQNKSF